MITLYTAATANGQKAAIALEEAGLDYRIRILDLAAGEHLDASVLALNPVGRIPFIEPEDDHAGRMIYGTLPVAIYAAERTGRLLPAAGPGRYAVLQWAAFAATDLGHAFANQFLLEELVGTQDARVREFVHRQIARMLGIVEERLEQSEYLAGDEYSIADVLAYPSAANSANRLPRRLEDYPNIRRWADGVGGRPAVARGMAAA
ncbi:glutathione S-transferase family protein [Lentisalinibacter sediminis]|uniref:glutathione S-transferase family protein n=1 Tax=Lentisalinibacter sediminis TaxID=2992237 RepID=UPI0038646A7C